MGLPISILENILHNKAVKPGMPAIIDDYNIELKTGEIVTIKELIDFWIEGHKAIKEIEKECNTTGKKSLIQSQSTGKKSRKSTKKMTTTQK